MDIELRIGQCPTCGHYHGIGTHEEWVKQQKEAARKQWKEEIAPMINKLREKDAN